MSIEPQIIKFLKKNAMTTHKCAEILVERIMKNIRYTNVKLMLKDIRKTLMREIKRHKNIVICTGNIKQMELYFETMFEGRMRLACLNNDECCNIIVDELHPIFKFTNTNDIGHLWDDIDVVIKQNMTYVMLTFMMNEYYKILKRFLITDISMVILSYVYKN